jgi:acyl-CoA reductase-like NAD-dependent aldehyde dehydrogenase
VSHPEVMIFQAVATAEANNTLGYPKGEIHPVLIFLREKDGAPPDRAKAAAELASRGWSDVTISEAAAVLRCIADSVHPHATASYQDALNDGFAALVFSEPVTSTDLTPMMGVKGGKDIVSS